MSKGFKIRPSTITSLVDVLKSLLRIPLVLKFLNLRTTFKKTEKGQQNTPTVSSIINIKMCGSHKHSYETDNCQIFWPKKRTAEIIASG